MNNQADVDYERVHKFHLFFGGGVEYGFSNSLALRGEVEFYDEDAQFLSIGLLKRFGLHSEKKVAKLEDVPPAKLESVTFEANSSILTHEAKAVLDKVAQQLQQAPDVQVEVQAHTDDSGPAEYNVTLSEQRAQSVAEYLVSEGVDRHRLIPKGYGNTEPRYSNHSPEDRRKNRRVEFKLLNP